MCQCAPSSKRAASSTLPRTIPWLPAPPRTRSWRRRPWLDAEIVEGGAVIATEALGGPEVERLMTVARRSPAQRRRRAPRADGVEGTTHRPSARCRSVIAATNRARRRTPTTRRSCSRSMRTTAVDSPMRSAGMLSALSAPDGDRGLMRLRGTRGVTPKCAGTGGAPGSRPRPCRASRTIVAAPAGANARDGSREMVRARACFSRAGRQRGRGDDVPLGPCLGTPASRLPTCPSPSRRRTGLTEPRRPGNEGLAGTKRTTSRIEAPVKL